MAKKKGRSPLAVDEDDVLYVESAHSGIHPLVQLCDGMSLTFFGKSRKSYLRVDDVIAWHAKELEGSHGHSGSRAALDAFREIKRKFDAGEVETNE